MVRVHVDDKIMYGDNDVCVIIFLALLEERFPVKT